MNKICIYTICKNEKKFVDKWLTSMKEADSIAVLDTGSTDGTYEYLLQKQKEYPHLIVKQEIIQPWRFDVARNKSMELIPKDCNILMCTDLDEVLTIGWSAPLREYWIEGKHERGTYLYTWSHLENGEDGRVFGYDKIHSRNWRWRAPVHEYLYNLNTNLADYDETNTLNLTHDDRIHLHHYPDWTKSRGDYLPLLEQRAQEFPDDYYGLIYLAHEYKYRGLLQECINEFEYIFDKFKDEICFLEKSNGYLFMGDSYLGLGQFDKAAENYLKAIEIDNTYREPYLGLAQLYFNEQRYDEAKSVMRGCIQNTYRHYNWLEGDISWSWGPWDLLCQICFYKGEKLESIAYAAKALSYEPNNQRLKNNLDICIELSDDKELII